MWADVKKAKQSSMNTGENDVRKKPYDDYERYEVDEKPS
jgi:hypothetical protein